MGGNSMSSFLLALFGLVTAAVVVACLAIYRRRRRRQTHPTVMAKQPAGAQGSRPAVAERPEPAIVDRAPPPLVEAQIEAVQKDQETQPIITQEAQVTIAEGAQPTATQQVQPTGAEKAPQLAIEKAQPGAAPALPPLSEGRRIEPVKRGGKPRGSTRGRGEQPSKPEARVLKPEIVCWERGREWIPAVEVPQALFEKPDLTVLQNESSLLRDELEDACWRLEQAHGEIIIRWSEGEVKVDLGQEGCLLFKLSGPNQNRGRRVKSPSSGAYLVMVPDDWERDEAMAGPPHVAPEPVSLEGYRAHFFELEKDGDVQIAFRRPNGEPLIIASKATRFELIGDLLKDASENMGPLFVGRPPQIRDSNEPPWRDVSAIVIGEEGGGKRKWRMSFAPQIDRREQDLPAELAARKGGWYFLRFYDANDELIESLDFRFMSVLKEIKMPQPPLFPLEGGHPPAHVEFHYEPGCVVQPTAGSPSIQIERQDDKAIAIIPPDPAYDQTHWLVRPENGPQIEVTILVERLWWGVGEERHPPSEWADQPIVLSRDDFAATSSKALWLCLPRRRWAEKILVGFEQSKSRPYDVRVTERMIAIPLREYGDYPELEDESKEKRLKAWIKHGGQDIEGVLAIIPASKKAAGLMPDQMTSLPGRSWVGWGRKKSVVARAVMQKGSGKIRINGKPMDDHLRQASREGKRFLERLLELEQVAQVLSQMDITITVKGSSSRTVQQSKAVAHAIARALMRHDPSLTSLLKRNGFGGSRVKHF